MEPVGKWLSALGARLWCGDNKPQRERHHRRQQECENNWPRKLVETCERISGTQYIDGNVDVVKTEMDADVESTGMEM